MYFKLKQWVFERSGRLMYLGGNGLNCEVTMGDDATCAVYRTTIAPTRRPATSLDASDGGVLCHLLGVVFTYTE
jgi:hypothetical protein